VLALTATVHTQMLAHAIAGLPNEACGLFAGPLGSLTVDRFHPLINVAASSQIYQLDGQQMLEVETATDADGRQVLGVMHSHTHTSAYPSPTDVADAATFDPFGAWHFVIVSLKHADPVLRSFRIADGEVAEETVTLADAG
jgi:proteasome lid subunit RPN8/RPN11